MRGTNCIVLRHEAPYIPRENPSLVELHPRHARERRPAQQEDPARTPRPGGRKFRPPSRPLESTNRRRSPQGPRLTAARRFRAKSAESRATNSAPETNNGPQHSAGASLPADLCCLLPPPPSEVQCGCAGEVCGQVRAPVCVQTRCAFKRSVLLRRVREVGFRGANDGFAPECGRRGRGGGPRRHVKHGGRWRREEAPEEGRASCASD